jgi:hypothetical protein
MDFETTDQDVNPETSELGHTFSLPDRDAAMGARR